MPLRFAFKLFTLAIAVCGLVLTSNLSADVLLTDDFSYADGDLTANAAWNAHSGAGNFPAQVTSGQVILEQSGGSHEDASTVFGAVSGILGVIYEFDLIVNDDAPIVAGDDEYFAHFMTGTGGFVSRLDISAGTGGGDYSLGIGNSSTADASTAADFTFGNTVAVSVTYDYATGQSILTVGGETISTTTAGTATALDTFALRQATSASQELITVDNLVISSITAVPEPTSLMFLGAFGLVVVGSRRRRS